MNSRTKRHSTGFGDEGSVTKLSLTPFCLVIHVEMGKNRDHSRCERGRSPSPFPGWWPSLSLQQEAEAVASLPLSFSSTAGSHSLVAFSDSASLFALHFQSKETNHCPTHSPRRCSNKTLRTIKKFCRRRFFIFPLLVSMVAPVWKINQHG